MAKDVFTDKKKQPTDSDLKTKLGPSYALIERTISPMQSEFQGVSAAWKFSKSSGWYVTYDKKKKRLFYLFPADGDFVFKIVFNDKCLKQIKGGSFPEFVMKMIENAKKYPEGTLCTFDRSNFKPDTILELLRIKINN